jgi:parallel beta-helix repeat protein
MRYTNYIIFGLLIGLFILGLSFCVNASDTYVDDDAVPSWYDSTHVKTIQEGIDNATVGATVYIWDGIYYCEGIMINKSVSLIGNGTTNTVLEWDDLIGGLNSMVLIHSVDNVNISDLHFNNSQHGDIHLYPPYPSEYYVNYTHIYNCLFTNSSSNKNSINMYCSAETHANYINISNNEFYNGGKYSMYIKYCENITIFNNTIQYCYGGVALYNSKNSVISYNNILYSDDGESIGIPYSTNSTIYYNTMKYGNWTSLYTDDGTNNCTIYNNTITDFNESGCFGVELYSSYDNLIYNNYFNNIQNAYDDGLNTWNISKTLGTNIIGGLYLGGNYWNDYTGGDINNDGLGDTNLPYTSSINSGGDYHPLTIAHRQTYKEDFTDRHGIGGLNE